MMAGVGAEMTEVAADEHGVPGASGTGATGRRGRRVLIGLSFVLIVPILLICSLVVAVQRRIIFPLVSSESSTPSRGWASASTAPGLHVWTSEWRTGRRTVLMFHGNAVTLGDMAFVGDAWVRDGWNVVLVEFPGYDGNDGSPDEASLDRASDFAWRWAATHGSVPSGTVMLANSIGTGPAARLVGNRHPAGFLVVSGVDDLAEVVRGQVPFVPSFLVMDRFHSADAIRDYPGCTRVWHADDDVVVPASQGVAIARAAGTAVVRRRGGHQLFWDPDLQAELRAEADRIVPSR